MVPKLIRILMPELIRKKLLSSLTKILLWKAAQRESLPKLTKIFLPKPSREIATESHQKYWYESCPERFAAETHQNIAIKAVQRNCCHISTKYCCESCPETKHGTIPGEAKAAKTADETNAFSITATEQWNINQWQEQTSERLTDLRIHNHYCHTK